MTNEQYYDCIQPYQNACQIMRAKLEVLNGSLYQKSSVSPIHNIQERIKAKKSIEKKLEKLGHSDSVQNAKDYLRDIAGIRVICYFIDDIYNLVNALKRQSELIFIREKDYIKNPKPNGYRSFHVIIAVPVYYLDTMEYFPVEIQLRTMTMDLWASMEHRVCYKKLPEHREELSDAFCQYADILRKIEEQFEAYNETGMLEHFYTIADNVNIPIYIYNVPARTGICISPEIVAKLSCHKNIAGIKEASGDISYVAKLSRLIDDDFSIYSGNDDITVALMSMGAAGTVSVWANLMPDKVSKMAHAYLDGDTEKAKKIQLEYLNLINALFCETNPVPIKAIMNMKGMRVGGCRLPLGPLSSANRRVLRSLADDIDKE